MALFGGKRDAALFKRMNRELINKIINTEVVIYQLSTELTRTNIYGESIKKIFFNPIRMNALISREDKTVIGDDSFIDFGYSATFSFLRDELVEKNFVISTGDIIKWDNDYYEANNVFSNQLWAGKNPDSHLPLVLDQDREFGFSVSVKVNAYKTTPERLNIQMVNKEQDYSIYDLPNKT